MAVAVTACPADTPAVVRHNDQVPVTSLYRIALTRDEETVLTARARSLRGPYRDRLRAQIVLAAAGGSSNAVIAAQVGTHVDTVRKWRRRFAAAGVAGLKDAPRSGRPPVYKASDRAEATALACTLPAETGTPLSTWSSPDLARELAARCQITASASTIRRWLASRWARATTSSAPMGRPPRPGHRPVRGHHRHRAVLPAGGAGDDR
jgi:transposase